MRTILVAADLSPFTDTVVGVVAEIAAGTGAAVHLLHVIPPPSGFETVPSSVDAIDRMLAHEEADVLEKLAALSAGLATRGIDVVSLTCLRGEPADEIVARRVDLDADLVVVGANSTGPLVRTLLGSVSAAVLREAGCPVLVVPPAAVGNSGVAGGDGAEQ